MGAYRALQDSHREVHQVTFYHLLTVALKICKQHCLKSLEETFFFIFFEKHKIKSYLALMHMVSEVWIL